MHRFRLSAHQVGTGVPGLVLIDVFHDADPVFFGLQKGKGVGEAGGPALLSLDLVVVVEQLHQDRRRGPAP